MEQDKLNFTKNYLMIKDNFTMRKKDVVSTAKTAGFISLFAIFALIHTLWALPFLLIPNLYLIASCISVYYYNYKDIENCNVGNIKKITYKEFKQMKKSGELQQLIDEINKQNQQEAAESYKAYLEFVKGKTYTPINITEESEQQNEIDKNTKNLDCNI